MDYFKERELDWFEDETIWGQNEETCPDCGETTEFCDCGDMEDPEPDWNEGWG